MARLKPIRLEKWISTKNGSGDFKETVVKYNLWAEVERQGGSRSSLNKLSLSETVRFRVRFRPELRPNSNWKVVYNGKRYTVSSIEQEKEDRFHWVIIGSDKG